ncbi:MAG: aldo/keto reductase [Saccharothrix sp.]|nr:aldo/keto reductase [Saccharothrix sp.]
MTTTPNPHGPPVPLVLGGSPLGNLYRPMTDGRAHELVDAAWAAGVRHFDTAPHYGLGLSERRLGAALADRPRAEFTVSTKVGRLLVPDPAGGGRQDPEGFAVPATHRRVWDFSADGVRRGLEESLRRLGLDHVDVVYLHDPDDHWEQAATEAMPALVELRDSGAVGAVGVGLNQWRLAARFVRETDVDVVMLAGRYTLLDPSAGQAFLPLCLDRGVDVAAAGVFNSGLLARHDVPDGATYDYRPAPPDLLDRARRIAAVCARHDVELPRAALWFPLGHPAVSSSVVGLGSTAELDQAVTALAGPPPAALWRDLEEEGLLDEHGHGGRAVRPR